MKLAILKDYAGLSQQVAAEIIQTVKAKPNALLCLPSGESPKLACTLLPAMARQQGIDFSRCYFIGLDEWVGVAPDNEGSCSWFFHKYVFGPLGIKEKQIHQFNALAADLPAECNKMDSFIKARGGIDLMVVGLGMNGHIGFNEPGVAFDHYSHIINLDDTTKTVAQKYFVQMPVLLQGITLGFQHLMESRKLILMANGLKKAPVVKKMLEDKVSNELPASVVRLHGNSFVVLDKEAASMLSGQALAQ